MLEKQGCSSFPNIKIILPKDNHYDCLLIGLIQDYYTQSKFQANLTKQDRLIPLHSTRYLTKQRLTVKSKKANLYIRFASELQLSAFIIMASTIKNLIQEYKNRVQEQKQWSSTSKSKLEEAIISKKIGELFLSIVVTYLLNEEGITTNSEKELQRHKKALLQRVKDKQKQQVNTLVSVFGEFIIELMKKDTKFSNIYRQLDSLFDASQPIEQTYDFNSDEDDDGTSMYSKSFQISQQSSIEQRNTYTKLLEEQSISFYSDVVSEKDEVYEHKINQYISKLSAPQTELSYLCQHFGWRKTFKDNMTPNGNFVVSVIVDFDYKSCRKELVAKAEQKNKRLARMLSAARMLRNLYMSFPQIWNEYKKIKNQKSLIIPEDDLSTRFLKQAIKVDKVEIVKIEKQKEVNFQKQLSGYLSDISSFKAELNVLLQQITGTFKHPKMEKIAYENKWKVKGQLHMLDAGVTKTYTEVEIHQNSKLAEQAVAKKLIVQMYNQNRQVLETMAILKKKKGFRT